MGLSRRLWITLATGAGFGLAALVALGACRSSGTPPPAGAAGYVGSAACKECHDRVYASWQQTLHAKIVQDVRKTPQALQGDWGQPFEHRKFEKKDVRYIHGVQWKQRYINEQWQVYPAQWDFESQKWAGYNVDKGGTADWRKSCAYCHVVGFDGDTLTWAEFGIGCEACHGPGERHVKAKPAERAGTIVNPASLPFDYAASTCGQCHTRGKSPDGKWDHPIGFRVGDYLTTAHYVVTDKKNDQAWWPDGSVKQHRQQYPEWKESRHAKAGVTCIACHSVHEATSKFATRTSPNNLCVSCHATVSTDSVTGHAPIAGAPQHSDCVGCHMARTGKSADRGDERVHTFRVVKPEMTLKLGGGDPARQPNSCNGCHWHAQDAPASLQKALEEGVRLRFGALGRR
jgi:predicted CXXCH cytochrome family protein